MLELRNLNSESEVLGSWWTPEHQLIAGIIELSFRDLTKKEHKAEALTYLMSEDFELHCEWLDVCAQALRARGLELLRVKYYGK